MVWCSSINHNTVLVCNNSGNEVSKLMARNLGDNEKIDYILIGIAIGIGLGFMVAMWVEHGF